jgi:hypothetical protein
MAFNQVTATSLTPSRPAPPIPIRQASIGSSTTAFSTSSSVTLSPASASTSSYASSYSGIGGTPNIGGFPKRTSEVVNMSGIVRQGPVGFKEDAFASWIWREKWLILREQSLSVHKNEVGLPSGLRSLFGYVRGSPVSSLLYMRVLFHALRPSIPRRASFSYPFRDKTKESFC